MPSIAYYPVVYKEYDDRPATFALEATDVGRVLYQDELQRPVARARVQAPQERRHRWVINRGRTFPWLRRR
eukprot:4956953-Prymnesium_polylepis.1